MDFVAYLNDIRAGKITAPKTVQKIYTQLEADLSNPDSPYIFDVKRAQRPIEFIERFCKQSKGEWAGQPLKLLPFQRAFISALFGFVDKATGLRRFRETFLYMSRKNGKTETLSAIALYCLIADKEAGAEVYCAATKKAQARILFDEVLNMVRQSPDLSHILRKRKADLYCAPMFAKMQPLGKNADTLDGLNAYLIIIDECHAVKGRELYEVLKQSQSARRQPLLITITTAGTLRESIFDDLYGYSRSVVDGSITDKTFLPILYELDDKDEWRNPAMWIKANPSLGAIKKVSDLKQRVERAETAPAELNGLLCKDFNVISNVNSAWLTWDAINNPATFNIADFRGWYAVGGVDLSLTTDLTCATLLMMDKSEARYVWQMYWIPETAYAERRNGKIPYAQWKERGLLRLCSGNTINPSDVTAWFLEMVKNYSIIPMWTYYDSYSARYFVEEMEGNGFNMVRCIQGAKTLSTPMQQLGADLTAKRVNYGNHPILKWCIANTNIQEDRNGNIVPVKRRNPIYRIDGLASLLDSYVGLMEHYTELKGMAKR
ncbi:MAG: terminase large subunit [Synergistaceae bacterium]|nr:terminase large subunit [Synergistaceae bacterium]